MSIMPVSQYPNGQQPQLMTNLPHNPQAGTAPVFGQVPVNSAAGGFPHAQPGMMPAGAPAQQHLPHGVPPLMQPIVQQQQHQQPVYVMVSPDQKGGVFPQGSVPQQLQANPQMLNPQAPIQQQPVYVVVQQPQQLQQQNQAGLPPTQILQAPVGPHPQQGLPQLPQVLLPGLSVLGTPVGSRPISQINSGNVTNSNSNASSVTNTPRLFDFDAEKSSTGKPEGSTCGPSLTSLQSVNQPRAPCEIGTPNLIPFPPPAAQLQPTGALVPVAGQLADGPQLKLRKSKEALLQDWAEVKVTQHKSRRSSRSKSKKDKTLENYLNTMKCFVRHIAADTTEEDLFLFASQFGIVKGLLKKNEFGGTLNCAFITFDCIQSANHFAEAADGSTYFTEVDALIHKQTTGEEKEQDARLPPLSVRMAESLEDRAERVKRRQIENALARAQAAEEGLKTVEVSE